MISDNSMLDFSNLNDFLSFYERVLNTRWNIQTGDFNTRGKEIYNKPYTEKLRLLFHEKKLFRRTVSIAEIVSWLDSYVIIKRLINFLNNNLKDNEFNRLSLYCEYRIAMSKNRRIDFVFEYENKLLLIEFRLSEKFPNVSNVWQKKELELIIYKELMSNYIKESTKIYIYAFIAMPEYRKDIRIDKHVTYNHNNVKHLGEYIIKYLIDRENEK